MTTGVTWACQTPLPPSDRVNLAVLGVNGRGMGLISSFAALSNAQIVSICDPDQRAWAKATAAVQKITGKAPSAVSDLRRVLDDKSIDGVIIATPDHWHAPATIMACEAGKDVYVEKPASHNLREGRLMVNAARQLNNQVPQRIGDSSMANTYTALYDHIVFSTKNRIPYLKPQIEARVWAYIGGVARVHKMVALQIGGVEDHIHVLVKAPPNVPMSQIAQFLKGDSSKWIHQTFPELRVFAWQDGSYRSFGRQVGC